MERRAGRSSMSSCPTALKSFATSPGRSLAPRHDGTGGIQRNPDRQRRIGKRRVTMTKAARLLLSGGLMLLVGSAAGHAQGQSVRPDFSGEWVAQDPGSGTWSEWFDNVPAPALRPEIVKMNRDDQAKLDAGNVTNTASRRPDCPEGNLPMTMANSGSKTIVVAGDHLEFAGRLIYTD